MVAISLYRGNLHSVPDKPRRWLMPTPKISLRDFKSLLTRRSKSLSRLLRPSVTTAAVAAAATSSNPNLEENVIRIKTEPQLEEVKEEKGIAANQEEEEKGKTSKDVGSKGQVQGRAQGGLDGAVCLVKREDVANLLVAEDNKGVEPVADLPVKKPDDEPANPYQEATSNADELNEKEKRKREVEEKLKVLNAKKHNLVQALKQIMSVEEELKRRNTMQGMAARPSGPLQVDVSNDSGSMTKHVVTPRMGADSTLGADAEGGEAEDVSNHNIHSRHIHRMSSTSPSSESPLRRPPYNQHNMVPHPSKSTLGTTGSPSRFAPTGPQSHPANLPAVSVSGTNYVASSPSPAASGGTSAFRDARQPSPWN